MRLEHHLVGGYVRYISPYIIIIIKQAFDQTYISYFLFPRFPCFHENNPLQAHQHRNIIEVW